MFHIKRAKTGKPSFSARQSFCAAVAVRLAVAVYLGPGHGTEGETASWVYILAAVPVTLSGFFSYNDITLKQFIWAFTQFKTLCIGQYRFVPQNLHYEMLKQDLANTFRQGEAATDNNVLEKVDHPHSNLFVRQFWYRGMISPAQ